MRVDIDAAFATPDRICVTVRHRGYHEVRNISMTKRDRRKGISPEDKVVATVAELKDLIDRKIQHSDYMVELNDRVRKVVAE